MLWLITATKLQLWNSDKNNFMFGGVTTTWRTGFRGHSISKVEKHCTRGFFSSGVLITPMYVRICTNVCYACVLMCAYAWILYHVCYSQKKTLLIDERIYSAEHQHCYLSRLHTCSHHREWVSLKIQKGQLFSLSRLKITGILVKLNFREKVDAILLAHTHLLFHFCSLTFL